MQIHPDPVPPHCIVCQQGFAPFMVHPGACRSGGVNGQGAAAHHHAAAHGQLGLAVVVAGLLGQRPLARQTRCPCSNNGWVDSNCSCKTKLLTRDPCGIAARGGIRARARRVLPQQAPVAQSHRRVGFAGFSHAKPGARHALVVQQLCPCTSVMAAWANSSCLAANADRMVCVASMRERKNVT